MPEYEYKCTKCDNIQSQFKSFKDLDSLGKIDAKFKCKECGALKVMERIISSGIQVKDPSRIRLNGDPKKEAEYEKRSKDPERARQNRIKKFGSEGVSITKSPFYKKEKKIKAQGNSDVDKKQFIQSAARNPNALKAAQNALKRAGKKE
jgi:putative FmdB family regulatory protein